MSGLLPHDPSSGRRRPRPSATDPSTSAGAFPPSHEMPVWPVPEYLSQPMQPQHFGHGNVFHAQRFGRPPAFPPTPPVHPTPLDFSAMSGQQPSYQYPDSYRPPMYRQPPFGAQSLFPTRNDGPGPVRLTHPQYPLPHFTPPPFSHQSYDHPFQTPPFPAHVRFRGDADQGPQDNDSSRSAFPRHNALTRPDVEPSPPIVNGNPRERARASRQRPSTSPPQRQRQSSGRRPSYLSSDSAEEPAQDPSSITYRRGYIPSPPELRESFMQRQREMARVQNNNAELSPQSDTSDNDAMLDRRHSREAMFRLSTRHHGPPTVSEEQINKFKAGLKKMVRSDLPEGVSTTCNICEKDYSVESVPPCEEAEIAVELPCKHLFGEDCLNTWLNTCKTLGHKITCPMCRKVLVERPARRPGGMRMWPLRYGSDPSREVQRASNLLSDLDDEIRFMLTPEGFEHFRAALAALGDAPVTPGAMQLMFHEAILSVGRPGNRNVA